eukprot:3546972-Rhodomonas_salina.1
MGQSEEPRADRLNLTVSFFSFLVKVKSYVLGLGPHFGDGSTFKLRGQPSYPGTRVPAPRRLPARYQGTNVRSLTTKQPPCCTCTSLAPRAVGAYSVTLGLLPQVDTFKLHSDKAV